MVSVKPFVLLVVALVLLPSDSVSQSDAVFEKEAYRVIRNTGYLERELERELRNFPLERERSQRFKDMISIFQRTDQQIPPGGARLPFSIYPDYVPWPRRVRDLPEGLFPIYFPKTRQDRLGRRYPLYAPFQLANGEIWFFPFDRKSLKLRYPTFAPATAYFFGNSTTRFVQVPWRDDQFENEGNVLLRSLYWGVPVVQREGEQPEYEFYSLP